MKPLLEDEAREGGRDWSVILTLVPCPPEFMLEWELEDPEPEPEGLARLVLLFVLVLGCDELAVAVLDK